MEAERRPVAGGSSAGSRTKPTVSSQMPLRSYREQLCVSVNGHRREFTTASHTGLVVASVQTGRKFEAAWG